MSSFTFGQKSFQPRAPEKGSFPLDHEGLCKQFMLKYLICLKQKEQENTQCRVEAKAYFDCRMRNKLMVEEEWSKLGYSGEEAA